MSSSDETVVQVGQRCIALTELLSVIEVSTPPDLPPQLVTVRLPQ